MLIYLNNAATSYPKPNCVQNSVNSFFRSPPINSLRHCNCIKKDSDVDIVCKKTIKDFIGLDKETEVILTPGATYSVNIAINAISKKLNNPIIIMNNWCHNCITRNHFSRIGTNPILLDDFNDIQNIKDLNENYYVAVTHQNNIDGNKISDVTISKIISFCRPYNIPILLDITQSIGCSYIDISKYNYNNLFVFASFHKSCYSVPGIGFLTIPKDYLQYKLLYGSNGGIDGINYKDTNSFDIGTPNELAMKSVIAGIDFIQSTEISNIIKHKEILSNYFFKLWNNKKTIMTRTFKIQNFYPESGIISLIPLNIQKAQELVSNLTEKYEIICRFGVHCSPLYHFNVLKCNSTLRFSFGYFNTKNEIDYLFESFDKLL